MVVTQHNSGHVMHPQQRHHVISSRGSVRDNEECYMHLSTWTIDVKERWRSMRDSEECYHVPK